MTLYVDEQAGFFGGTARAGDIQRLGLIKASLLRKELVIKENERRA